MNNYQELEMNPSSSAKKNDGIPCYFAQVSLTIIHGDAAVIVVLLGIICNHSKKKFLVQAY